MKGQLEIFENRLKAMVRNLPGMESRDINEVFLAYEAALGNTIPFYDVKNGMTLADYYASTFVQFVKNELKK